MGAGGIVPEIKTDDGRVIYYSTHERRCCECSFRIEVGDPMVMDDWGWIHPTCLISADE